MRRRKDWLLLGLSLSDKGGPCHPLRPPKPGRQWDRTAVTWGQACSAPFSHPHNGEGRSPLTGSEGKTCRRKAWHSGAGAWTCSWERQLHAASPEPADCASDLPQTPRAVEEEWPGWLFSLLFSWRKSSKEKRLPHCDSLLSLFHTRHTHTAPLAHTLAALGDPGCF